MKQQQLTPLQVKRRVFIISTPKDTTLVDNITYSLKFSGHSYSTGSHLLKKGLANAPLPLSKGSDYLNIHMSDFILLIPPIDIWGEGCLGICIPLSKKVLIIGEKPPQGGCLDMLQCEVFEDWYSLRKTHFKMIPSRLKVRLKGLERRKRTMKMDIQRRWREKMKVEVEKQEGLINEEDTF